MIVDARCRYGGVPDRHADLMKVGHHVPGRIKAFDRRSLILVHKQRSAFGAPRPKLRGKIGAHLTAESPVSSPPRSGALS
jgi:hypothetical protein